MLLKEAAKQQLLSRDENLLLTIQSFPAPEASEPRAAEQHRSGHHPHFILGQRGAGSLSQIGP